MMVDVMGPMTRVIPLIFYFLGGRDLVSGILRGVRNFLYFLLGVQVIEVFILNIFILLSSRGHFIYLPSKHCIGRGHIHVL